MACTTATNTVSNLYVYDPNMQQSISPMQQAFTPNQNLIWTNVGGSTPAVGMPLGGGCGGAFSGAPAFNWSDAEVARKITARVNIINLVYKGRYAGTDVADIVLAYLDHLEVEIKKRDVHIEHLKKTRDEWVGQAMTAAGQQKAVDAMAAAKEKQVKMRAGGPIDGHAVLTKQVVAAIAQEAPPAWPDANGVGVAQPGPVAPGRDPNDPNAVKEPDIFERFWKATNDIARGL